MASSAPAAKPNAKNQGKHPLGSIVRNGLADATTDIDKVSHWWTLKPDANIGIALDGYAVIDVDPRHGGDKSLAKLEARQRPLPKTRRARTGGGGEHYYFRLPAGVTIKNDNRGGLGPGLDVKTTGGYVLVAPSLHVSGNRYEWIEKSPAVELPTWLIFLLSKTKGHGKVGKTNKHWHETLSNTIQNGTRDCTMTSIAGKLLQSGVDVVLIHDLLNCVNVARCNPPLPDVDIKRILTSVVDTHIRKHGSVK
jgi:hypothetical protein